MDCNLKISVIVPVFNVEKYIDRCINSLVLQTYRNIEIILVNDGSSDLSGSICDRYSSKYDYITSIHQPNKGVSAARNLGISIAQGKYVCFVDADDHVSSTYLEDLVNEILINNVDLVDQSFCRVENGKCLEEGYFTNEKFNQIDSNKIVEIMLGGHTGPVSKIFIKGLIDKYLLRFNEEVRLGEDMIFVLEYINVCEKGVYLSKTSNYYYNTIENSLSTRYVGKDLTYIYPTLLSLQEVLIKIIGANVHNFELYPNIKKKLTLFSGIYLESFSQSTYSQKILTLKGLREGDLYNKLWLSFSKKNPLRRLFYYSFELKMFRFAIFCDYSKHLFEKSLNFKLRDS